MLPLDLGPWATIAVFFLLGTAFGIVLELAGFGDARKLSSQFYFRDMTVFKTMFTGIVTAAILIFLSASFGFLDFSKLFVNQTFLWPGIIGGLVVGVGFVVGGYCPGTSIVSAASFKLDGILFVIGVTIGVGIFGETVSSFSDFWNSSYTERLLLSDVFGWSLGQTVFIVTALALVLFYFVERVEASYRTPDAPINWRPTSTRGVAAAAVALGLSGLVWANGQPSPEKKWDHLGSEYQSLLDQRDVFIHPFEWVRSWNDSSIKLVTLDLRPAAEFQKFHLDGARNVTFEQLTDERLLYELNQLPDHGLVIVVADEEAEAVRAWKRLKVLGVSNLYLLENGLRDWEKTFSAFTTKRHFNLSHPPARVLDAVPEDAWKAKIKLKTARRASGLCG
ncbi:MAG: rhodanese-like domain-containing protein [Myxococcales bacterium]|nr:rhodanese-like domain-containing protein [Myxococcales bacterium]